LEKSPGIVEHSTNVSLEHVKHLRTVNFTLIAIAAGAIILAIATGEPLADKAMKELKSIIAFVPIARIQQLFW